ncbi:hypothetical protein BTM25_44510 [Actinomadura rubteroloni]|uniref:Orc1-like AAA ATPase domain-containing protein n=1 Tax=Actinomadura rubteroloni TaxID=1926885 RepID=A0A2P4UE49_9ACTN|nr:ATP-binding protein [Actinomadura rubteroloni]POM23298.1 hypothetical protein BTM25_44510 [Actinomadura rubteroloni]
MDVTAEGTIAARLERARARRFVGRSAESALLRDALRAAEPGFAVLYVHGPGGVGKTALLGELARVARDAGAVPVRVDGRATGPSPEAFAASARPAGQGRTVLFIDTYEAILPLDGWIRETLIPGLPADALVVIAGRTPPPPGWSVNPGWRDLLRVVRLDNLDAEEIRDYAAAAGAPPGVHERLAAVTHGHPLALTLLTDILRRDPGAGCDLAGSPDVVDRLTECFLADAPSPRHRRALQAAAHARFTTEPLLRAALDGEAGDLYTWLSGLAFVEHGPHGLFPHDLVRDVVAADLRRRDPQAHADLHHRVRRHLMDQVGTSSGRQQARWITDVSFLARTHPVISRFWDWDALDAAYPDPPAPSEHAELIALAARHQGPRSADLLRRYLVHPAATVAVFRSAEPGPRGFAVLLRLDRMSDADLAADPATAPAWAHVRAHGPLAAGEQVTFSRFLIDRDHFQDASPTRNAASASHSQRILGSPDLAFDFLGAFREGAVQPQVMAHVGYDHLPGAAYEIDGARHGVFVRDWRGRTPESWIAMLADRDIGRTAPADDRPFITALTHAAFTAAVRTALRDLHAPDRLAVNPLLGSRVVGGGGPPALRAAVRAAIDHVRDDPQEHKLYLVLDRTYLRPAPTQEIAAELLSLSLSTYRRHHTAALARVTALLWTRERDATLNHP